MRLPLIIVMTLSLSACASLWPFGDKSRTGNCMDDDSCEAANPFEEQLVGGTWYCYGVDRDDWDCSQTENPEKIIAFSAPAPEPEPEAAEPYRAEMDLQPEVISNQEPIAPADAAPVVSYDQDSLGELFRYPDDSFAVQLIALETVAEIEAFATRHAIDSPLIARIRNQDKDWYVLVLEVSDSRDAAQRIADAWQASNNPRSKPWVRPLGPLKQAVQSAADGE